MAYKYLNKFIDLGVEKNIRHHKFYNDEIDFYISLRRIRIRSNPDRIRNTATYVPVPYKFHVMMLRS
jgi:hypothetical protein